MLHDRAVKKKIVNTLWWHSDLNTFLKSTISTHIARGSAYFTISILWTFVSLWCSFFYASPKKTLLVEPSVEWMKIKYNYVNVSCYLAPFASDSTEMNTWRGCFTNRTWKTFKDFSHSWVIRVVWNMKMFLKVYIQKKLIW